MKYGEGATRPAAYRTRIAALRTKMRAVQRRVEPQPVDDYTSTGRGTVRASQLFRSHRDLFVVHNMGSGCPCCTLWADGSRAAFVISSPDPPQVQRRFARSRGWHFPMVSHQGTTFAEDMGYRSPGGGWLPGISVFRRRRHRVVRVSDAAWSPGDDFCTLRHTLDLLDEGAAGWQPKLGYAGGRRPRHRGGQE